MKENNCVVFVLNFLPQGALSTWAILAIEGSLREASGHPREQRG